MENFEENLFLKANLEKEIPILRAQIQNLYEQLDRKFHLQGAKVPITFGMDTDLSLIHILTWSRRRSISRPTHCTRSRLME